MPQDVQEAVERVKRALGKGQLSSPAVDPEVQSAVERVKSSLAGGSVGVDPEVSQAVANVRQALGLLPTEEPAAGEETSAFLKALDVINTPQQALFGVLTRRPGETLEEAAKRGARQNLSGIDVLSETILPGARDIKFTEQPLKFLGTRALGLSADFLLDPLIFVPFTKLFRAAGTGIRATARFTGATEFARAVEESKIFRDHIAPIAQKFNRKAFRTPRQKEILTQFEINRRKLGLEIEDIIVDLDKQSKLIKQVAKETDLPEEYLKTQLTAIIETKVPPNYHFTFETVQEADEAAELADVATRIAKVRAGTRTIEVSELAKNIPPGPIDHRKVEAIKKSILRTGKVPKVTVQFDEFGHIQPITAIDDQHVIRAASELGLKEIDISRVFLKEEPVKDIVRVERIAPKGSPKRQLDLFDPITTVDESRRLVRSELKNLLSDVAPEVEDLAKQFIKIRSEIEAASVAKGLPLFQLDSAEFDYLLHLLTREAREKIVKAERFRGMGLGRRFSPAHASQLARQIRNLSIFEANELARMGKLPGFEGLVIKQLFITDPAVLTAVRKIRQAKAIADLELLQDAAVRYGRRVGTAPESYKPLAIVNSSDERLALVGAQFQDIVFPEDVADLLNEVVTFTVSKGEVPRFIQYLDTVHSVWRAITLAPFPAYHARNAVGNLYLNYLAGLKNPKYYAQAAKLVSRDTPDTEKFVLNGIEYSAGHLRRMLKTYAVTSGGQTVELTREAQRALGQIPSALTVDIPGVSKVVKGGFRVGRALENNARIAHFLFQLDRGKSGFEASLSVTKFLFDYQAGLTEFEINVLRRVLPFYSWTRFNVPLQIRMLVENPRPTIRLAELQNIFRERETAIDPVARDLVPEFVKQNSGIPIRTGEDGNPEYFLLGGWIPAADLETVLRPDGPLQKAIDLLSPFVRVPVEQAANIELLTKRAIEKFPREQQELFGGPFKITVRRRLAHLAKMLRIVSELDRIGKRFDQGDIQSVKDIDFYTQIVFPILGAKTFKVDLQQSIRNQRSERNELLRRLYGALRKQDPENVKVLLRELNPGIQDVEEEFDEDE